MGPKRNNEATTGVDDANSVSPKVKNAKVAKPTSGPISRDVVAPIELPVTPDYCTIMSWNVAGLRGLVKNKPDVLKGLVAKHKPDVLCLQETKLQDSHVPDFKDCLPGYEGHFTCSQTKLGYAGTAVFVKGRTPQKNQKSLDSFFGAKPKPAAAEAEGTAGGSSAPAQDEKDGRLVPINVTLELPDARLSGEGRTITVEFNSFFLVACYVPNSGQKLERLDYRVKEWDVYMQNYLKGLEAQGKPVVYTGDLNVGHLDLDIWNPSAKHISKQAGLTVVEREAHSALLESGYVDAFRWLYPCAHGQFTYWSQRAMARPPNKGIRLDYFICSPSLLPAEAEAGSEVDGSAEVETPRVESQSDLVASARPVPAVRRKLRTSVADLTHEDAPVVVDSYILHKDTEGSSDHCPVVLVLRI
jgi:exodeoxyribonuclease III